MKDKILAAVFGVVVAALVVHSMNTPVVMISATTHKAVACANAETNWKTTDISAPACNGATATTADVEWVK